MFDEIEAYEVKAYKNVPVFGPPCMLQTTTASQTYICLQTVVCGSIH